MELSEDLNHVSRGFSSCICSERERENKLLNQIVVMEGKNLTYRPMTQIVRNKMHFKAEYYRDITEQFK